MQEESVKDEDSRIKYETARNVIVNSMSETKKNEIADEVAKSGSNALTDKQHDQLIVELAKETPEIHEAAKRLDLVSGVVLDKKNEEDNKTLLRAIKDDPDFMKYATSHGVDAKDDEALLKFYNKNKDKDEIRHITKDIEETAKTQKLLGDSRPFCRSVLY